MEELLLLNLYYRCSNKSLKITNKGPKSVRNLKNDLFTKNILTQIMFIQNIINFFIDFFF